MPASTPGTRFDVTYKKAFVSKGAHVHTIVKDSSATYIRCVEGRIMWFVAGCGEHKISEYFSCKSLIVLHGIRSEADWIQ